MGVQQLRVPAAWRDCAKGERAGLLRLCSGARLWAGRDDFNRFSSGGPECRAAFGGVYEGSRRRKLGTKHGHVAISRNFRRRRIFNSRRLATICRGAEESQAAGCALHRIADEREGRYRERVQICVRIHGPNFGRSAQFWAWRRGPGNEWRPDDLSPERICCVGAGKYGSASRAASCFFYRQSAPRKIRHPIQLRTDKPAAEDPEPLASTGSPRTTL